MKIIIAFAIIQFLFWLKDFVCVCVVCVCVDRFLNMHTIDRSSAVSVDRSFCLFVNSSIIRLAALVLLDHLHKSSEISFFFLSLSLNVLAIYSNTIFCRYRHRRRRHHHSTLCVCLFILILHMSFIVNRRQTIQRDGWHFCLSHLFLSLLNIVLGM